jgi:hypothetical protein
VGGKGAGRVTREMGKEVYRRGGGKGRRGGEEKEIVSRWLAHPVSKCYNRHC